MKQPQIKINTKADAEKKLKRAMELLYELTLATLNNDRTYMEKFALLSKSFIEANCEE